MSDPIDPNPFLPQARALGVKILAHGDSRAKVSLPYREDLVGDPDTGVIAGGVITTLLDHCSGHAVNAALTDDTSIATLDLRIDYMRGAEPGRSVTWSVGSLRMRGSTSGGRLLMARSRLPRRSSRHRVVASGTTR